MLRLIDFDEINRAGHPSMPLGLGLAREAPGSAPRLMDFNEINQAGRPSMPLGLGLAPEASGSAPFD